jgi:hypothetical protein
MQHPLGLLGRAAMSSCQQQDRVYTNPVVLMQPRLTLPFPAALIHVLLTHRLDPQRPRQVGTA